MVRRSLRWVACVFLGSTGCQFSSAFESYCARAGTCEDGGGLPDAPDSEAAPNDAGSLGAISVSPPSLSAIHVPAGTVVQASIELRNNLTSTSTLEVVVVGV